MYFNSFEYVVFLWSIYVVYWTLKEKRELRFSIVLVASYWFYAQADWRFCSLLFISTVVDYFAGARLQAANEAKDDRRRKAYLLLSVVSNLGMLGFFKYYDFFVDSFEGLFATWGTQLHLWHLSAAKGGPLDYVVPAGISFYTFQTLSYTIDIYYRRLKPCKSHLEFAVYVAFFPQLVAGPIVRARDFLPQMDVPKAPTRERISLGLWEILRGMARKLVIADIVGQHLVDAVYRDAATLERSGGLAVVVATYGFMLQIFGDFAGYSDIAIGSSRLLGFDLKKNFDRPFRATSIESFWSRWHISMTSWFYLYVFAPIIGRASGMGRICLGLFLTLLLSGVWHGAGWNFVLWGAWLGAWMVISRLVRNRLPSDRMPDKPIFSLLGWIYTTLVVGASLVLFRSHDTASIAAALHALGDWRSPLPASIAELPWQVWTALAVGYAAALWPDSWNERMLAGWHRLPVLAQGAVLAASMLFFLGVSPPGLAPFIYFQF